MLNQLLLPVLLLLPVMPEMKQGLSCTVLLLLLLLPLPEPLLLPVMR